MPGASLYTATALDEGARIAGIEGERLVGAELERLAAEYRNTYVFHSVKLPGAIGDIDHLVVQGNRILLVDSKNWRAGSDYRVAHSDGATDYITRDGERFEGGEIHLGRQMRQWAQEFADYDVQGALVLASALSGVSSAVIGLKYVFANLDGLTEVLAHRFAPTGAPAMDPALLGRLKGMLQAPPAAETAPAGAPTARRAASLLLRPVATFTPSRPVPKSAVLAILWAVFNWTVLYPQFFLGGLSAAPLVVFAHWQLRRVRKEGAGGTALLVIALTLAYAQLAIWTLLFVWMIATGSYGAIGIRP